MINYYNRMKATGQCPPRKPFKFVLWSCVGSFVGIYLVALLSSTYGNGSVFLIGSFGASAVLLYGAPLADVSQPRNLIGGHVFSAVVGVSAAQLFDANVAVASAFAVSISVAVMLLTRTLHPPGGATAFIAVAGGDKIHQLGYGWVICPVLIGSMILLFVALLINNISRDPRRHYPSFWI